MSSKASIKKPKVSIVKDPSPFGMYVWRMSNGKIFGDPDGNVMNIPATEHDITALNKIRKAARNYGVESGGFPVYISGGRRVSEMEHSEELGRMKEGYIPSETDFGAWIDAKKGFDVHGD